MSTHTTLPWRLCQVTTKTRGLDILCVANANIRVCSVPVNTYTDNARVMADAAFIVRACNSHAALVAALQAFMDASTASDIRIAQIQARAALKIAEGEA